MGTRRRTDWIQFGALLLSIVTLIGGVFIQTGKIMQQLEDQQRAIVQVQQRLSDLEAKWDRFQATHQAYLTTP